ncbi:MAG: metallophosphoesterase [Bacteroidales bacterium]|nr:metallophosphoesterase [Bacteroidales bacterium]
MKKIYLILLPILLITGILTSVAGCNKNEPTGPDKPIDSVGHIRWGTKLSPLEKVTISWRSAGSEDKFRWGYTSSCEKGEFDAKLRGDLLRGLNIQEHTFDLLEPSSMIYYSIYDSKNKTWTDQATFQTAPDPTLNHFKFTAGGDSRTNQEAWHLVSEAIERLDFSIFLGDLVNNGMMGRDWEDWYAYGEKFISKNLVFYVRGNHDIGNIFNNNLVNPGNGKYYAFEFADAIFIGLDDHDKATYTDQTEFIDSVFSNNTDKIWRFVFFHRPFYTSGRHAGEMDDLFDSWWKLFDDYGVDMIFNGHEHCYSRTKPINRNVPDISAVDEYGSGPGQGRCQIIAGSYGAPRYPVHEGWFVEKSFDRYLYTTIEINGNELIFKAIDAETGEKFDELILNK